MDWTEKELVWVPKELAEKINELGEGLTKENLVLSYIEQAKRDIQGELDSLDESILLFRGMMVKARQDFEKAKNAELEANYAVWENSEKDFEAMREKAKCMVETLKPLKEELQEVCDLLNRIDKWGIEGFLELLKKLNQNFYGETKEMLQFLLNNWKKS